MPYTLQAQLESNKYASLSLTQQPYLQSTQTLIHIPSLNQIIYHGYRQKQKQDLKTQKNAQKVAQQAKPKKKFNFKVNKNTQSKPLPQISQKISFFSLQQNLWQILELKGKPPMPRENHCLISMNSNTLIMYGGKSLQNQKILNDLHILNTQTLLWKKLFSIECPSPSQSNIIIRLTDTKIILINFKQLWTFQTKDVKWELNTNELPGGLWQNLQIKIDSLLNSQRQILLTGLTITHDESQNVIFFTVDKNSQHITCYSIDISSREINKIKPQKDIFVDDLQNIRNLLTCKSIQQNQFQQASNMVLLSMKKNDYIEANLLKVGLESLVLKIISTKQTKLQSHKVNCINGQCFDQQHTNLYFLAKNDSNIKEKLLRNITLKIENMQPAFLNSQKKSKNQISSYLNNSQIHSIPEESNQSSLIGIKNHKNQRYQEFQDQLEHYNQHHHFMINSQRQGQPTSRPSSEVNRSPSVISNQQKSEISEDEREKNQIQTKQERKANISQLYNNSNIYFSPGSQKPHNQIENNSSNFPEEQYLQSTLQKILVFQHLKRQKLQEKTQFLQRSIKNSQSLSKLLTKFATPNEKNHHIDQVKYLKQELENIWNKEIFFRKQIQHHFVSNQNQSNIRNSVSNQRYSREMNKQNNKGKIDMRKLLQKHNFFEQE